MVVGARTAIPAIACMCTVTLCTLLLVPFCMVVVSLAADARPRRPLLPTRVRDFSGDGQPELQTIEHEGTSREYFLYVPKSVKKPAPLVLLFHGGGGQARGVDKATGGMAALADEKGFAVAYPNGIDRHWNDGRPDLTATDKLVDPSRVYATGISNGGFFSQYLALKCPDKIAAVAPVVASVSGSGST